MRFHSIEAGQGFNNSRPRYGGTDAIHSAGQLAMVLNDSMREIDCTHGEGGGQLLFSRRKLMYLNNLILIMCIVLRNTDVSRSSREIRFNLQKVN